MNHKKDALWSKVILRKYCSSDRRSVRDLDKLRASPIWTAIKLGFQTFVKGISWGIGDGTRIKVWFDCWIKGESLRELVEGPLTRQECDMVVVDMINGRGQRWNWGAISFELPPSIKDKIRAVPCQRFGRADDTILWKYSKDGEFLVKSAYDIVNPPPPLIKIFSFRGNGFGNWICCQRLYTSFGCVCTTVYQLRRC